MQFARCPCYKECFWYPQRQEHEWPSTRKSCSLQDVDAIMHSFGTPSDGNINDIQREKQCNSQDVRARINTFGTPATGTSMSFDWENQCNLQDVPAIINTFDIHCSSINPAPMATLSFVCFLLCFACSYFARVSHEPIYLLCFAAVLNRLGAVETHPQEYNMATRLCFASLRTCFEAWGLLCESWVSPISCVLRVFVSVGMCQRQFNLDDLRCGRAACRWSKC